MPSAMECRQAAQQYYKAGNWERTLAVTASALDRYPDDGVLWEMRALALHACKRFVQAMDAFEHATLLKPLSYSAQVGLASCYLATRQTDLASQMYRHVAARADVPTPLLSSIAAGLMQVGAAQLALEMHRERVRRDPDDAQAVFALAHYMNHLGGPPEKVLPLLRKACALAPDQPVYRVGLALMLARFGDIRSAYQVAVELPVERLIDACCPCRLRSLAILFHQAGNCQRARACQQAVEETTEEVRPDHRDEGGARRD